MTEVLGRAPLEREEREALEHALNGDGKDLEQTTFSILDALVARGALLVLERVREGGTERLRLRDPVRRIQIRIRRPLASPASTPEPKTRTVPLPIEATQPIGLRTNPVQQLLSLHGNLISSDRVMTPREIVQRLERTLVEVVPVTSAVFLPLEMPPGEEWGERSTTPAAGVSVEEVELLSLRRDRLTLLSDRETDGSILLMGLGDEGTGWRGVLRLGPAARDHFSPERLEVAQLVAQHFQSLLSTSIRLQGLIFYDFLTGIYNRSYFEEQMEREIAVADRRGQSMGLVIVDIDDFKAFNTRYGYDGGDRVLATVACVLKGALRNTDTLARYGGEEFAVILAPPVSGEEARIIAERLRSAVEEEALTLRGLDGAQTGEHVTISVGGTLYPDGGRSLRELWNEANRLLLSAKSRGKNQVRFTSDPE